MEGYIYTHKLCSGYFPDHIPLDDNTFAKLYDVNDKPRYYPYIVNGRYLKQIFNSNSKYNKDYLLNNMTAFAISKKFWGESFPPPQKSYNKYGNVTRINNNNSSTIEYSNKSKDNNKYNNRIITANPSHPADPYTFHHGHHPGDKIMPDKYRYRHRHNTQGEDQDGGRGVGQVNGGQYPHHAQSENTRPDGYPKLKYRESND